MKTITYTMPASEIEAFNRQPVLLGCAIIEKLKALGVPVNSILWVFAVHHGELTTVLNAEGLTFTWTGDIVEDDDVEIW